MKKIMFNDKYCLTKAVLDGTKTMTRRVLREGTPLGNWEETTKHLPYKVGDIVAIAQPYKDIIESLPMYSNAILNEVGMPRKEFKAGWTNKMFVRADLMPHHIRITDVKIERLQDISEGECRHEGIGYHRYRDEVWSDDSLWGYYVHKNGLLLFDTPHEAFISLIDKISGKGTWENNPWVVVYSFELVD